MISELYGKFITLDGKEFPFNPGSRQSRQDAGKKANEHNAEVIAQREAQAGRKLSLDELMHGIKHPDDRTLGEVRLQPSEVAIG